MTILKQLEPPRFQYICIDTICNYNIYIYQYKIKYVCIIVYSLYIYCIYIYIVYIYIVYIYIYVSYNINKMHTMVKWNSPNLLSTQLLVNVQRDVISQKPIEWSLNRMLHQFHHLAVCQNLVPLVNIKIAGKWMFIPLKMVLIGIAPYPFWYLPSGKHTKKRWKIIGKSPFLMGKSTINGLFSIAMLVYQRVLQDANWCELMRKKSIVLAKPQLPAATISWLCGHI